eukprot:m.333796 g.333796  ORF g.333796 m.333796 type:complete len:599 (+) comp17225_c0_seq1:231-2027(+)
MDDDLGDLGEIMGEDYDHGYDDGKGDPNVKPKPAAPPVEDVSQRTSSTLGVVFKEQQQFLTKLVVQAVPLLNVVNRQGDPFNEFSTSKEFGGQSITVPGEPTTSTTCFFKNLLPGMPYVFRLVCTNPAGTVVGRNSRPILTVPAPPKAPVFVGAKPNSIFIRFGDNSRGGKQVVNKLTIGVARAGPADPFDPANKPGEMSDSSPRAGSLKQARIQKLTPGTLYVFRITIANSAGVVHGAISAPMLTSPGTPSRLREDPKHRTDSTVMLKFKKHGQHLSHLTLQYTILTGAKGTFDQLMKKEGKQVGIPDPQNATSFLVKELEGNKKYVFRLASKNKSGISIGTVLGPITTVEHAPEMNDKSGWMTELNGATEQKKGLGRRLSSRGKDKGKKYWYVIDGRLLSWFDDINGEEIGFLHLSKLKRITYIPDADGQAKQFSLLLKTGQKIALQCHSTDPNMSTHDYCMSWMSAIQKALSGLQKSKAEYEKEEAANKKQGRRASVQAADDDELEDDEEEEPEDFEDDFDEENEDTFAGDFGGFGDDDDEEEEDDDGEFGAGSDEEGDFEDELEEGEEAFGDDFDGFDEGEEEFGDDDFDGFGE